MPSRMAILAADAAVQLDSVPVVFKVRVTALQRNIRPNHVPDLAGAAGVVPVSTRHFLAVRSSK
jgi:hypothetical protein